MAWHELTADRIARWMMWAVVMLFSVIALAGMTFLLGWSIVEKFESSLTLWMAALALCFCVAVGMVGKRVLNSIVAPPPEVELTTAGSRIVGGMRGLLAGGIVSALIFGILWAVKPVWLFAAQARWGFGAFLLIGVCAGALYFPPVRIFRRERIWLAVTLAAGIFLVHLITGIFLLAPMKFDYRAGRVSAGAFPFVSEATLQKILPQGALDIHLRGWRGFAPYVEWECTATPEQFAAFAALHGYKFSVNDSVREVKGQKYDLSNLIVPSTGRKPEKFDFYARFNREGELTTLMLYDRTTGRFVGRTQ